jgi:hypothetical protein
MLLATADFDRCEYEDGGSRSSLNREGAVKATNAEPYVKGAGELIGKLGDPSSLRRWLPAHAARGAGGARELESIREARGAERAP